MHSAHPPRRHYYVNHSYTDLRPNRISPYWLYTFNIMHIIYHNHFSNCASIFRQWLEIYFAHLKGMFLIKFYTTKQNEITDNSKTTETKQYHPNEHNHRNATSKTGGETGKTSEAKRNEILFYGC